MMHLCLHTPFKGTSNPLDAMVNIGLHPLKVPDLDAGDSTKIDTLIITGHSLDGGYAQLFLGHLLSASEFEHYFETVKCITFAAPLVYCQDVRNSFFTKS